MKCYNSINIYKLLLAHSKQERKKNTKMTRDLGALVDDCIDDMGILLGSSSGLLLLGMIIMSIPIISMVIFACGDNKAWKKRVGGGGCGGGG